MPNFDSHIAYVEEGDGKPWSCFQHKSGTCFLVQIQFSVLLNKNLNIFSAYAVTLSVFLKIYVLLSTF